MFDVPRCVVIRRATGSVDTVVAFGSTGCEVQRLAGTALRLAGTLHSSFPMLIG